MCTECKPALQRGENRFTSTHSQTLSWNNVRSQYCCLFPCFSLSMWQFLSPWLQRAVSCLTLFLALGWAPRALSECFPKWMIGKTILCPRGSDFSYILLVILSQVPYWTWDSLVSLFHYVPCSFSVWAHLQQELFPLGTLVMEACLREGSSLPLLGSTDFQQIFALISPFVVSTLWKWWEFGPHVCALARAWIFVFHRWSFLYPNDRLAFMTSPLTSWWVGFV